jgi:hypothetical protein
MQRQRVGGSTATVSAADKDCVRGRVGRAGRGRDRAFLVERGWRPRDEEGRKAAAAVAAAWQGRQRQPRGKEGSGGHSARKVAAARQRR